MRVPAARRSARRAGCRGRGYEPRGRGGRSTAVNPFRRSTAAACVALLCATGELRGQTDSRPAPASRPVFAPRVLVLDPDGKPLPVARVWAVDPDGRVPEGVGRPPSLLSTSPDRDGLAAVQSRGRDGRVAVQVEAVGYETAGGRFFADDSAAEPFVVRMRRAAYVELRYPDPNDGRRSEARWHVDGVRPGVRIVADANHLLRQDWTMTDRGLRSPPLRSGIAFRLDDGDAVPPRQGEELPPPHAPLLPGELRVMEIDAAGRPVELAPTSRPTEPTGSLRVERRVRPDAGSNAVKTLGADADASLWAMRVDAPDVRPLPRRPVAAGDATEIFAAEVPPGTWRVASSSWFHRFAYRYPFLAMSRELPSYCAPAVAVAAGGETVVVLD
jgi:hypothetical protein